MWTVMTSPIGDLRIVEHRGSISAIEFSPFSPMTDGRPRGDRDDAHPVLMAAVDQLTAYFARERKDFDLPLAPVGTEFQQPVGNHHVHRPLFIESRPAGRAARTGRQYSGTPQP